MIRHASLMLVLPVAFAIGCGGPQQSGTEGSANVPGAYAGIPAPGDVPPPAVRAQLDSGNAAYSSARYEEALRHYREAARAAPGIAASWFGIQMAAGALGNRALADSARERIDALAPGALPQAHSAPLHAVRDSAG